MLVQLVKYYMICAIKTKTKQNGFIALNDLSCDEKKIISSRNGA